MSTGRLPSTDGGIQPTVVDAKGDLLVGVAADSISRLAVGSNDQVLTADSSTATGLKWAAPSSGSLTLLSTTTLSGATVTLSSINQTYNHLFIVFYGMTNDTSNGIFKVAPNGTTNIASGAGIGMENNTAQNSTFNNSYLQLAGSSSNLNRTNANNVGSLLIQNYANSTYFKTFYSICSYVNDQASTNSTQSMFGAIRTTTAITSLVFSNDGGNLSTGTVLLYGVK